MSGCVAASRACVKQLEEWLAERTNTSVLVDWIRRLDLRDERDALPHPVHHEDPVERSCVEHRLWKLAWCAVVVAYSVLLHSRLVSAQTYPADVDALIRSSCIECHDAETETRPNFKTADWNLSDPVSFRRSEKRKPQYSG
jgi:hypothetical protein